MDKSTTYDDREKIKNLQEVINMADGAGFGFGGGFALIVVLFILLIIVGAAWVW